MAVQSLQLNRHDFIQKMVRKYYKKVKLEFCCLWFQCISYHFVWSYGCSFRCQCSIQLTHRFSCRLQGVQGAPGSQVVPVTKSRVTMKCLGSKHVFFLQILSLQNRPALEKSKQDGVVIATDINYSYLLPLFALSGSGSYKKCKSISWQGFLLIN